MIYGGPSLNVHLSLLFTAMIRHSFVPGGFSYGIIVPLLKTKHADSTNIDTYRGITLSSVLSKVFEYVLLRLYGAFLNSDSLQFGFKKQSGCNHALFTLKSLLNILQRKDQEYIVPFWTPARHLTKFCTMVSF